MSPEPVTLALLEDQEPRGFCGDCGGRLTTKTGVPLRAGVPGVRYTDGIPTSGWAPPPQAPTLLFCNARCRRAYLRAVESHPAWKLTTYTPGD